MKIAKKTVVVLLLTGFVFECWAAKPVVEIEEVVTRYAPANNGASPMWCYGSTVVARHGDDVFVSVIETGEDVPLLCNTRWQLWHRSDGGSWKVIQKEENYRQREPCPIGIFNDGRVFLSVNPSTQPRGTMYGACRPLVLEFDSRDPTKLFKTHEPVWPDGEDFTDHSYRGFAADGANGELLLLNINSGSGEQFVSFRDSAGKWSAKGKIRFPIRSCYPQVALKNKSAHVLAIGDIVEPVEEWQQLKFEKLNRKWDYVFRRLFYTYTPDIENTAFCEPVEVDSVERTGGHITNLDLYIDEEGVAHMLYLKRPHQYAFIRDKYFPGEAMTVHLEYVTVKQGAITARRNLTETRASTAKRLEPSYGRFHIDCEGELWVVVAGKRTEQGRSEFANCIGRINDGGVPEFVRIPLEHPFRSFFTNSTRAGCVGSDTIDLFGIAEDSPNLRYGRIRLK